MGAPAEGRNGIVLSVYGRTHVGRVRRENQDRMLFADLGAPPAPSSADALAPDGGASVGPLRVTLGPAGALLLVADGMGGRAGGARASEMAVGAVLRAMRDGAGPGAGDTPEGWAARLRAALEVANREIHEEALRDERLFGMGTTATLAGVRDGAAWVAQVGDSRAYLVREGTIGRLTRDQSLAQGLIDSGVLTEEEARSTGRNRILQALGPAPAVRPEVTSHELRRGDTLLLCSDGLSRMVSDEEIRAVVEAAEDERTACERLIDLANERGGPDNVTVLLAGAAGEGLSPPAAGEAVAARAHPGPLA